MKFSKLLLCSALAACPAGELAFAQSNEATDTTVYEGEIIVTAQKRAERLQDVPISVSAATGEMLDKRGIATISGLSQLAPNVALNPGFTNPTALAPFIRGVGTFANEPLSDPPIAVSVDGVYLASVYGALVDLFDVEQVEVLRGPQGTLQGRNAPGGALNVTTRRPGDTLNVRAQLGYGRFDDISAKFSIDGPLVDDVLGAKLSIMRRKSDGYTRNLETGERYGGRNTWAGRLGLAFNPSDALKIFASADYTKDKSPPSGFRAANTNIAYPRAETGRQIVPVACSVFGFCSPDPVRTTRQQSGVNPSSFESWGLSVNAEFDTGPMTISSVTGYREITDITDQDLDALPVLIFRGGSRVDSREFSQELRLASNPGGFLTFNDTVSWIFGAYYMNFNFDRRQEQYVRSPVAAISLYGQELNSFALFGHVDVSLTDKLDVYFGGRQTWDKKEYARVLPTVIEGTKSFSNLSTEAGVRYKFTPDHMAYFRFSQGYKAGGFNPQGTIYRPEKINAYEVGFKTQWFDRALQLNASAFMYDYKDLQRLTSVLLPVAPFFQQQTRNAAAAKTKGVELELVIRPVDDLRINAQVGYLHAKYDKYIVQEAIAGSSPPALLDVDNSALRLPFSPKWTISGGFEYDIRLGSGLISRITPAVNFSYKSAHTVNAEDVPVQAENGYILTNATLTLADEDDRYSLSLYADNIFSEHYIIGAGTLGNLAHYQIDALPRTYGVRFNVNFH